MMMGRSPDWMIRQTRTMESLLGYQRDLLRMHAPTDEDEATCPLAVLIFRGAVPKIKPVEITTDAELARRFPIAARAIVMNGNGQNGKSLNKLERLIFVAQERRCFHCGQAMMEFVPPGGSPAFGWSREHVYPRGGSGRGLINNIVMAHPGCNGEKGDREPTPDEIERGRAIFGLLGLAAFVQPSIEHHRAISYLVSPPKRGRGRRQ